MATAVTLSIETTTTEATNYAQPTTPEQPPGHTSRGHNTMAKTNKVEITGTDLLAELDRSDGMVSIYLGAERIALGETVERAIELARSGLALRFGVLADTNTDELHGRMWKASARAVTNAPDLRTETETAEAVAGVA
jgi:hypothetical protein